MTEFGTIRPKFITVDGSRYELITEAVAERCRYCCFGSQSSCPLKCSTEDEYGNVIKGYWLGV